MYPGNAKNRRYFVKIKKTKNATQSKP